MTSWKFAAVALVPLIVSGCGDDVMGSNCDAGYVEVGAACVPAEGYADVSDRGLIGAVARTDDFTQTFYMTIAGPEPDCSDVSIDIPEAIMIEVPNTIQVGDSLMFADGAVFQHRAENSLALELSTSASIDVLEISGDVIRAEFVASFPSVGEISGEMHAVFCP